MSKSKPRIAFIVPDKIKEPVGGMGMQAKYLTEHLAKDFDFDIYGFPEENGLENYHSCFNPLPKILHHGMSTIGGQITYLTEIVKNKKPDLIHVADYTLYLAGTMASRALQVPLVASVQLSAHLMEQRGIAFAFDKHSVDGRAIQNTMREIELLGLREAKKIIHVSRLYKDIFAKELPELDSKSVYIPNGVDLEEYSKNNPQYKKIHLPGTRKRKVIYLGRFSPQKNVESLNNAEIPDNIDLIFFGKKENSNPIFEKMFDNTINFSNIHYYGPTYGSEKVNFLHAADAMIIPSLHECHPLVMHEAMASGCVVIHSGAGDMQHILTDDFSINCGITPSSISKALNEFSEMNTKEVERRKKQGLKVVQDYTWQKASQKTEEVYNSLLI